MIGLIICNITQNLVFYTVLIVFERKSLFFGTVFGNGGSIWIIVVLPQNVVFSFIIGVLYAVSIPNLHFDSISVCIATTSIMT